MAHARSFCSGMDNHEIEHADQRGCRRSATSDWRRTVRLSSIPPSVRGSGEREQLRNRGNEAALAEGLAAGKRKTIATITGESSSHANTACTGYDRQLGSFTDIACADALVW